jgi:hypothetical protein
MVDPGPVQQNLFKNVYKTQGLAAISDQISTKLDLESILPHCVSTNKKAGGLEETFKHQANKQQKMARSKVLRARIPIALIQKSDLQALATQNIKDSDLCNTKIAHKISKDIASNLFGEERTNDLIKLVDTIQHRK